MSPSASPVDEWKEKKAGGGSERGLTGLAPRRSFEERIQKSLRSSACTILTTFSLLLSRNEQRVSSSWSLPAYERHEHAFCPVRETSFFEDGSRGRESRESREPIRSHGPGRSRESREEQQPKMPEDGNHCDLSENSTVISSAERGAFRFGKFHHHRRYQGCHSPSGPAPRLSRTMPSHGCHGCHVDHVDRRLDFVSTGDHFRGHESVRSFSVMTAAFAVARQSAQPGMKRQS